MPSWDLATKGGRGGGASFLLTPLILLLKLLGVLFVVSATTLFGMAGARSYQQRCHDLEAFGYALSLLETEIAYGRARLPDAFQSVAERARVPASIFFGRVAKRLNEPSGGLAEMWREELAACPTMLTAHDCLILLELAQALGRGDEEEEIRHLERCQSEMRRSLLQAEEEARRKVRIWQMAGLLSGCAIALLLI